MSIDFYLSFLLTVLIPPTTIALISCSSKVFQSILNRKILKHLSLHNILSNRQCGFR
ncbi:hypothetical protein E2C01_022261 [Portunus trituberculatus]|uniref:F-box domain-containing protein n=1 Tax=Portunus trituberculatus TaxID=210409 RepID=A0A5B7E8F7_PORTR|nr:hypothetical protein [Portunus trituberculatus]